MTQTAGNQWIRRLVPLVVLALGAGGLFLLIKSRRPPPRKKRVKQAQLVQVITVKSESRQMGVSSNGVIQPRREVALASEVSGKVKWINPFFVVGGLIRSGATLLRIEGKDYKLAVDKTRSVVALAEKNLAVAESNARVARTEWSRMGSATGGGKGQPNPLTLHQPQLKSAQAALASARADLELAQLSLSRTVVRAPFNLRVREKRVDVGQYIRVGQDLGKVYGTDVAEVVVPLPMAEMRWLKIPQDVSGTRERGGVQGPPVTVRLKTGNRDYARPGTLVRSVGEVDPTGRMSKVVVAIEDPYNLRPGSQDGRYRPEFEIGAFVEVSLEGKALEKVIPIPAEALRVGQVVWVAGRDDKLQVRRVTVARLNQKEALILSGLESGDRVVLSNVTGAVEGMKLRVRKSQRNEKPKPEARR